MTDLASLEKKLDVLLALAGDTKRAARQSKLLTIPECAALYRISAKEVRRLIDAGELRAAMRKPRRGQVGYLVDARSAESLLGAR